MSELIAPQGYRYPRRGEITTAQFIPKATVAIISKQGRWEPNDLGGWSWAGPWPPDLELNEALILLKDAGAIYHGGYAPSGRDMSDELWLAERIRKIRLVVFDFDGVFTDNTVYVSEDGKESVRCWRGDGIGLRKLKEAGIGVLILSSEANPIVTQRCLKMEVECFQNCSDKFNTLRTIKTLRNITWPEVAYMGNDVNDLHCLLWAGLPITVRDAHESIFDAAPYQTIARGGRGAVREICDLFVRVLNDD